MLILEQRQDWTIGDDELLETDPLIQIIADQTFDIFSSIYLCSFVMMFYPFVIVKS